MQHDFVIVDVFQQKVHLVYEPDLVKFFEKEYRIIRQNYSPLQITDFWTDRWIVMRSDDLPDTSHELPLRQLESGYQNRSAVVQTIVEGLDSETRKLLIDRLLREEKSEREGQE